VTVRFSPRGRSACALLAYAEPLADRQRMYIRRTGENAVTGEAIARAHGRPVWFIRWNDAADAAEPEQWHGAYLETLDGKALYDAA